MKTFKIEFIQNDDGTLDSSGINDGFNAWELLGMMYFKTQDIQKQIHGEIKPDIVKRTVIVDEANE